MTFAVQSSTVAAQSSTVTVLKPIAPLDFVVQLKIGEIAADISYNQGKITQISTMVDPVSLTAGAIAQLAFQKFVESGAGKLAEKFTEGAIVKMDDLRRKIWAKLRGRPRVEEVKTSIEKTTRMTEAQVNQLAAYLQVAMDEDAAFAREIQAIAHEITLMQIEDNSSMTQVNYGGTNYQTKTGADNTNFFGGTHHHDRK